MHPIERLRVTLFTGGILAVYVVAAASLLRRPRGPWSRWVRRISLALAALGLLCFAYGWKVEPYWPEVVRVEIPTAKLPPGTPPLRLVQISDLHSDPKERLEGRLPDLVAAERPDLIVFTGDAINSTAGLPVFRRCLTRLAEIAPTFVVRGNWDLGYASQDLFGGTGARLLDGDAVRFETRGRRLWLAGIAVGRDDRLEPVLSTLPADEPSVLLHHYPDLIKRVRPFPVDLYCAAHTHGGQVALPLYGALVTFSRYGKKYESGLFRVGATWLYVNRGIGMEGGLAPRVRFCARPEVTVYEITPAPAPPG